MHLQLHQALAAFKAQRRLQLIACLGTSYNVNYTTTGNVTQAITLNSIMKLFKYFVAFSVCYCEMLYTKNLVYAVLVHLEFRFIQSRYPEKKIHFCEETTVGLVLLVSRRLLLVFS